MFSVCGEKVPKGVTNIIGGQLAKIGEYPWQVGVYNSDRSHICGGSLLSQRVVLSGKLLCRVMSKISKFIIKLEKPIDFYVF